MKKLTHFILASFGLCSWLLTNSVIAAETAFEKDLRSIKAMSGCFEVEFNYAETFPLKEGYKVDERRYHSKTHEWITPIEEGDHSILFQHILLAGQAIIKHWGAHWYYQNADLYNFVGHSRWEPSHLQPDVVAGQWTQKVTHVDDGPRDQCSAPWVYTNGKAYWECESLTPLPRREMEDMKRHDYDAILRRDREELTTYGWMQDEDNVKTIIKDGNQTPLVQEKGRVYFRKVEDSVCKPAQDWWKGKDSFWKYVRDVWAETLDGKSAFELNSPTFTDFGDLLEDYLPKMDQVEKDQEVLKSKMRDILKEHRKI